MYQLWKKLTDRMLYCTVLFYNKIANFKFSVLHLTNNISAVY